MSSSRGGGLSEVWSQYEQALIVHPIRTKAATAALLSLFGNVVTQKLIERRPGMELSKALKFMLFAVVLTPVSHFWYAFLDVLFPKQDAKSRPKTGLAAHVDTNVLKKLALDELIYDPFTLLFFFSFCGVLEGKSRSQIAATIRSQWWNTQLVSWRVWPAAMLFNFSFVPPELRMPVQNLVGLCFSIYLQVRAGKASRAGQA